LTGLTTSVQSLSFSRSGTLLAGVGLRTLAVWSTATGETVWRRALPETATAVAFAPDEREVAVGLGDGHIHVQSIDGTAERRLDAHGSPNVSLVFLPDQTLSGSDGTLERWVPTPAKGARRPRLPAGLSPRSSSSRRIAGALTSSLTSGHEWSLPGLQPLANLPGDAVRPPRRHHD
jgi:WD40 repeat protein